MPRILHQARTALLAVGWLLTSATPALAEDIEIYLGAAAAAASPCATTTTSGLTSTYVNCNNPNVLFILDDSGSMSEIVDSNGNGVTDAGEKSRMANMQDALLSLFSTINNVNVGLGNFSVPGGPILFPVADINASASAVEGAAATATSYTGRVSSSTDDAEERLYNNSVVLNSTALKLATDPLLGSVTVTSRPTANNHDMVEYRTNNVNQTVDSSFLMMGSLRMDHATRQPNASGVQFPGLAVPQGATISAVTLALTSNADTQTETVGNTTIRGELSGNAAVYATGTPAVGTAGNITIRPRTNASATATIADITPWSSDNNVVLFADPVVGVASATNISVPGLRTIVQEVVGQATWASGNALALMFGGIDRANPAAPANSLSGSGRFGAYTVNSSPAAAQDPLLTVQYSTGITNLAQDVGMRFINVSIPQGATITSAYIELVPVASASDTPNWTILGEAVDNATTFAATASNIHNRVTTTPTTANVAWAPSNWTAGTPVQTPSLTTVVQELVNRPGWCGNNSMNFMITGSTGARQVYSYDGDSTKAPQLVINYTNPVSGCINGILQRQPVQSNHDAEETLAGGSLSTSSTEFNITNTQLNGLYFDNISIAPGAVIQEAYLEFVAKAANAEVVTATIGGDVTTPLPFEVFAGTSNISARTDTSATVSWPMSTWATGSTYRSPDIKTVVQEIVNQPSWLAGYGLVLTVAANASQRRAHTFDSSPVNAPRLIIKAQSGGIQEKTVRTRLIEISNALSPRTFTPIVGYYTEAARYYKGEAVYWGRDRGGYCIPGGCNTTTPFNYPFPSGLTGALSVGMGDARATSSLSHFASYTGGTVVRPNAACTGSNPTNAACADEYISGNPVYQTPIVDECQNNYIVLLTDGQANQNSRVDVNQIKAWTTSGGCAGTDVNAAPTGEICGRELAAKLFTEDQNGTLAGDQVVRTYTIGFGADIVGAGADDLLRDIATAGGGAFYLAGDADSLVAVFQSIISSILSVNSGFEAPALSVNSYNRLTNREELYYALFKPSTQQAWDGNVKKYKLGEDGTGAALILDANNASAVDPVTGFFTDTAQSYWSPSVDGAEVADGGLASKLTATRNAYTYTGDVALPVALTQAKYALNEANTANVTTTLLGIGGTNGDTAHLNLLKWAHGEDPGVADAPHNQFGDPLHARPVVVSYYDDPTIPALDQALLATNNRGYFSIIDPATGLEKFTWVPKELLANLNPYYNNTGTVTGDGGKLYGLDADISLRVKDLDGDRDLRDAGDKVYATFGMRRGGRNYYSLDLNRTATNVYAPSLEWQILGGDANGDANLANDVWGELGQTWSAPKLAKVKLNGVDKIVYFFAGGYDPNQDNVTVRTPDTQGRAIYMADATTGALLWMAGNNTVNGSQTPHLSISTMDYSIPSDVTIIDTNGDGYTDRLYVGDMGGQIFRLDFANATNTGASSFATGGRIADLAGNSTTDNRRFYYAPDVALARVNGSLHLGLAIGSGYREHPLNSTIVDRFYVLRDFHITDTVATANLNTEYSFIEANLSDLTNDPLGQTPPIPAVPDFLTSDGWYITLEGPGEKVLARALTFNGIILFSTFDPNIAGVSTNVCTTSLGLGRTYLVNAADATSVANLDPLGTGKLDRVQILDRGGIPPEPVIVFRDSGDTIEPTLLLGSEVLAPKDASGEDVLTATIDPSASTGPGNSTAIDTGIGLKAFKTWWRDQP